MYIYIHIAKTKNQPKNSILSLNKFCKILNIVEIHYVGCANFKISPMQLNSGSAEI